MRIPLLVGVSLVVSLVAALLLVVAPQFRPEPAPEATTRLRMYGDRVRERRSSVVTTLVDELSTPRAAASPAPHLHASAVHRDDSNDLN
jgi:hypothetical protein